MFEKIDTSLFSFCNLEKESRIFSSCAQIQCIWSKFQELFFFFFYFLLEIPSIPSQSAILTFLNGDNQYDTLNNLSLIISK